MSELKTEANAFRFTLYFVHFLNFLILIGISVFNVKYIESFERGIQIFTSLFLLYRFKYENTVRVNALDNRIIYHSSILILMNMLIVPYLKNEDIIDYLKHLFNFDTYSTQYNVKSYLV